MRSLASRVAGILPAIRAESADDRSKEFTMKSHERILERNRSLLMVVDLQDAYRGKVFQEERVISSTVRLLNAAALLGVPVVLTEQYPKGLGATRRDIASHLPGEALRFEKTSFSALGAPGLPETLRELGRDQIVVAGIETHVCVGQTVHDLLARGLQVHAVRDAISSRFVLEDETGWQKLMGSGAVPSSVEGALFEWLRDANTPEFKGIQRLVV